MVFEIGMRVKILKNAGYRDRYLDEFGIVERNDYYKKNGHLSDETIGVRLDNYTNSASGYGIFWFRPSKLEITEKGDEAIMLDNYRVARISFLEGINTDTAYPYALYDDNISIGDIVVVQTGHHGLGIARVRHIDAPGENKKVVQYGREIIARVDFSAYEARQEKTKRVNELKRQMDAKVKKLQNQAIYEVLAEKDPALKAMLDEYKGLMD